MRKHPKNHNIMSLKVKVLPCINPAGDEGTDYASIRACADQVYDIKSICDEIILQATFSKADIVAVLSAMKEFMKRALVAGQNIVMPDFGILYPNVRSRCFAQSNLTRSDFNPVNYIKGCNVRFRPSTLMTKDTIRDMKIEVVKSDLYDPQA